jgi:hypothetical protein
MRRITKADMGKGQWLRLKTVRADKGSMVSAVRANASRAPRRAERESGQALVEFALILPLFLLIVVGIIQFGVALNFWLDMQRIANQGARWAVVDRYPLPDGSYCTESTPQPCSESLQTVLANQRIAEGEVIEPYICFPSGTSEVGDAVTVRMDRNFNFLSIVAPDGLNINLHASATMRLEQEPETYTANGPCP